MLAALRRAREDKNLSQAQLARQLQKPASFVGKYELGERRLDVVELLVILQNLNVSVQSFLDQFTSTLPTTLR